MTLSEIKALLVTADPNIKHYFSMHGSEEPYSYWEETRRLPFTGDDRYPDACRGAFAAHGMYGQRISVFPALDMVVAHKSAKNGEHPTRAGDYRELIRLIISAHDRPN